MIRRSDLYKPTVAFHRNGVAGAGFHLVTFRMRDGRGFRHMAATVFDDAGFCAVICTTDPSLKWRGDEFEPALREAIRAADAAGAVRYG